MKVQRRSTGQQEQLATILAGALRSGALEFDVGARTVSALRHHRVDEEEEADEAPEQEVELMPSRYDLLADGGHQRSDEAGRTVRQGNHRGEEHPVIRDEDLLLGIPRRLIRPEVLKPAKDILARLQISARSADSDDPGESVTQTDLAE